MRHDFDISSGVWGDSMSVNCSYQQQSTFSIVHSSSCLLLPHPACNPVRWVFSPHQPSVMGTLRMEVLAAHLHLAQPRTFPNQAYPSLGITTRLTVLTMIYARDSFYFV